MVNDEQETTGPRADSGRPTTTIVLAVVVGLAILAAVLFLVLKDDEPETPLEPPVVEEPQPEPTPEPRPEPEVEPEPEPEPEPLPDLDQSDEPVNEDLQEVFGEEPVTRLIVRDELLRKAVRAASAAAADSKVVHEYRPLVSPPPPLAVEAVGEARTEAEQEYRLLPENYARYDRYVALLTETDPQTIISWYQRYRPLLEEAYREQGVENGTLHEQLLAIIDELLDAPEPPADIRLERPKVFYEYRDPELEALPDLHKLMLRIGQEHHKAVKSALQVLKAELEEMPPLEE